VSTPPPWSASFRTTPDRSSGSPTRCRTKRPCSTHTSSPTSERDASYYAGLTSNYEWRTPELETRFQGAGARLARRLADQIGDDFQVEYDLGESHRRIRGAGPARNPDAAAAFHRLAGGAWEEWTQLRQIVDQAAKDESTLEWRAE